MSHWFLHLWLVQESWVAGSHCYVVLLHPQHCHQQDADGSCCQVVDLLPFLNNMACSRLTVKMEQKEGDFRFKHMELRSHVESLALSGDIDTELNNVNNKLHDVCRYWPIRDQNHNTLTNQRSVSHITTQHTDQSHCRVQQQLYNRNIPIDLSVNLFSYLGAILSYIVIAVPIFSGVYDDDVDNLPQIISNTAFVCMYLVYQLTLLVNITGTGTYSLLIGQNKTVFWLVDTT